MPRNIVYSTCPMWQKGAKSREELDALEKERLYKVRSEAFNSACSAIINAKPLYPHPGYRIAPKDN